MIAHTLSVQKHIHHLRRGAQALLGIAFDDALGQMARFQTALQNVEKAISVCGLPYSTGIR